MKKQVWKKQFGLKLLLLGVLFSASGCQYFYDGRNESLMVVSAAEWSDLHQFKKQSSWIAKACLNSDPIDPNSPVRLPGQQGIKRRLHQLKFGVALHPSIIPALVPWSKDLNVELPTATDSP